MLRLIQIHGPIEALDAVVSVGHEGLLDFQDYFRDQDSTYSALLVIFDDTEHAECEVLAQARALLAEKGADPATFQVAERWLYYPDALPHEWYVRMDTDFGQPLLALERLGVRTEAQQAEMDRLREEVRVRVTAACEHAEAGIEQFVTKVNALLGVADE